MREIKFRAWDNKTESMHQVAHILFSSSAKTPERLYVEFTDDEGRGHKQLNGKLDGGRKDAFELMQFTGLKDKNGMEIYESDLVAFTEAGKRKVGEVIWRNSDAMFVVQDKDGWGSFALHTEDDLEVTGNKYEKS